MARRTTARNATARHKAHAPAHVVTHHAANKISTRAQTGQRYQAKANGRAPLQRSGNVTYAV